MNEQELNDMLAGLMQERQSRDTVQQSQEPQQTAEIPTDPEQTEPEQQPDMMETEETVLPDESEETVQPTESDEPEPRRRRPPDGEHRPRRRRRRRRRRRPEHRRGDLLIGILVLLFAGIGVVHLLQSGIKAIQHSKAQKAEQSPLADVVLPAVLAGTPDFDSAEALSYDDFVSAAVWSIITGTTGKEQTPENGYYHVAAADVITAGNALFGAAYAPDPEDYHTVSFTDSIRFYYNPDTKQFEFPAEPDYSGCVPVTEQIKESEGKAVLTVKYQTDAPAWQKKEPQITKTAECTLTQINGTWKLTALHTQPAS